MDSRDIALWQAYHDLYPFSKSKQMRLIAEMVATMFNLWKGKDVASISVEQVLGIKTSLSEDKVKAALRSFKHGTN